MNKIIKSPLLMGMLFKFFFYFFMCSLVKMLAPSPAVLTIPCGVRDAFSVRFEFLV